MGAPPSSPVNQLSVPAVASYILALLACLVALKSGLLLALFAGLLVYSMVHLISPVLEKKIRFIRARIFVLVLLSAILIGGLSSLILSAMSYARSDAGNFNMLLKSMAGIIDVSRAQFPAWVSDFLPNSSAALQAMAAEWLRGHGQEAQIWGQEAGHLLIQLIMGMIIGGIVALHDSCPNTVLPAFALALRQRVIYLQQAFERIVFAQVRISAINAGLSAIYLLVILPASGVHLPLSKTMVLITFLVGLLPVVGNIISNTIIVLVSLSHSVQLAFFSLCYLIVIHKLEYFLNARIIGTRINAKAWELLIAILVMEALFGLPGVVAAPVFYAWLKMELGMGCRPKPTP